MNILFIILTIFIVLLLFNIAIGIYFYNFVFNRIWMENGAKKIREKLNNDKTPEGIEKFLKQKRYDDNKDEFNNSVKDIEEQIFIKAYDNTKIHARLINNNDKDNIWIVGVHGYRNSSNTFGEFINPLFKQGYNILLPDLRGCGLSKEKYLTMGNKDKYDVKSWVDYLSEKYPSSKIVIYGVSMGGATTMMTTGLKLPKNVICVIEDCGYSSLYDELKYEINYFLKLPTFPALNLTNLIYKFKNNGVGFKEVSSVEALKKNEIPMLFMHGKNDDFVPYNMLQKVYDANKGYKEKIEFDYTWHAEACMKHTEEYYDAINNFIKKFAK